MSNLTGTRRNRRIFLSYRRDDSRGYAQLLYDYLKRNLGEDRVFMDIPALEDKAGQKWNEIIKGALSECEVLIAVIGTDWLTVSQGKRRRLDDPDDIVRMEITTALKGNKQVIPVLVGGAVMPRPAVLPDSLKLLTQRQAVEITPSHVEEDLSRLVGILQKASALRGLGREYLDHVQRAYQEWNTKWTPLEVSYNLRLETWEGQRYARSKDQHLEENLNVRQAIDRFDLLVIVGEPGSGKTTAVRRMALEMATGAESRDTSNNPIPVVVPLYLWSEETKPRAGLAGVLELIHNALQTIGYDISLEDVRRDLDSSSARFIFFFDGLNEVPFDQRASCAKALLSFIERMRRTSNCKIVITSRKHNYRDYFLSSFETMEILELAPGAILDYLTRYLGDSKAAEAYSHLDLRIRRLVQNPLLLSFAAEVYRRRGSIPRSRGILIRDFVNMILRRELVTKPSRLKGTDTDPDLKHELLRPLGYDMQTSGQVIPERDARRIFGRAAQPQPHLARLDMDQFLEELLDCQILERVGSGIKFWHQALQEYFAADQMKDDWFRRPKKVNEYISKPKWHEPLAITAGLLPSEAVPEFVNHIRKRNVLLAGMCISNVESLPEKEERAFVSFLEARLARVCLVPDNFTNLVALIALLATLTAAFYGPSRVILHSLSSFLQPLIVIPLSGLVRVIQYSGYQIPYLIELALALIICLIWIWTLNKAYDRVIPRVDQWIYRTVLNRKVMPTLSALRYISINSDRARSAISEIRILAEDNPYMPALVRNFLHTSRNGIETQEELLRMLQQPQSQAYAVQMLGEIATDEALMPLEERAHGVDPTIAAGAVLALEKMAKRLPHCRPGIVLTLRELCESRHLSISNRRMAYRALVALDVRPLPQTPRFNMSDLRRSSGAFFRLISNEFLRLTALLLTLLAGAPGVLLGWWAVKYSWQGYQNQSVESTGGQGLWIFLGICLLSLPVGLTIVLPRWVWRKTQEIQYHLVRK